MNQDILDNLIEEVQQYVEASKRDNTPQWTLVYEMQVSILEEAKKRISSLPSDTQWIDVKTRLPYIWEHVLCQRDCWDAMHYFNCFWNKEEEIYMDMNHITHFLPIPPNN